MKKIIALLAFVLVSTYSFGQSKAVLKSAQGVTKEMMKVLNLNQEQEAKIYEIHLEKLGKLYKSKADKSLTSEEQLEARKEILSDSSEQFIALFGKEKWHIWILYNKQKRARNNISEINNF